MTKEQTKFDVSPSQFIQTQVDSLVLVLEKLDPNSQCCYIAMLNDSKFTTIESVVEKMEAKMYKILKSSTEQRIKELQEMVDKFEDAHRCLNCIHSRS